MNGQSQKRLQKCSVITDIAFFFLIIKAEEHFWSTYLTLKSLLFRCWFNFDNFGTSFFYLKFQLRVDRCSCLRKIVWNPLALLNFSPYRNGEFSLFRKSYATETKVETTTGICNTVADVSKTKKKKRKKKSCIKPCEQLLNSLNRSGSDGWLKNWNTWWAIFEKIDLIEGWEKQINIVDTTQRLFLNKQTLIWCSFACGTKRNSYG